jgi:biotin carboxyl carrier protein
METEITAPKAGKVAVILVEKGTAVQGGQPLIELEEA